MPVFVVTTSRNAFQKLAKNWISLVVFVLFSVTVFLRIVSTESILFLIVGNSNFLLRKQFKGGNYSRTETIRGNTESKKPSVNNIRLEPT